MRAMNETINLFRIKTKHGYYFTTGGGRYGRVTGTKQMAALLCENCADGVLNDFERTIPELKAEKEPFNGNARCQGCRCRE